MGLNVQTVPSDESDNIREQFGIYNSDPILLFLSRIHPKKGIELLLQALSQLQHQAFNLILAGSGEESYEQQIQQMISESHLAPRVQTVGFVQGTLKQKLLSQADLFVLTSYSENFGIVVLEALAAGTPTLITPGVALASLVEAHDLGWVCEMTQESIAQTMIQALSNPQILQEKGQHAQRLVRANYSWKAIAQKLIHQYQQVLLNSPKQSRSHSTAITNA